MLTYSFIQPITVPPTAAYAGANPSNKTFWGNQVRRAREIPSSLPQTIPLIQAVTSDSVGKKLHKNEALKTRSNQLRFPLGDELGNKEIFITEDAIQIMKFHGSYQQDDREKRAPGKQKAFQFMLRLKMPAGEMPAKMYLALDELSTKYGNNTLRATTRCAWQMHGILKSDLKTVFSTIMNNGGSTVGACGDINRNIVCTPAPIMTKPYIHARYVAKMLAEILAPQSGAFSEIWLDGEKAATLEYWKSDIDMKKVSDILHKDNLNGVLLPGKEEPIYGETYLPRKFKIGVTVPGDNSIDIYTQDIGIVVICNPQGLLEGYNIIVGGGLGRTHNKESTFARTGDHLGFVPKDKIYDAIKAIVATQRDHGNREVRANARMKYLVHSVGIDKFREMVESYYGDMIQPYRDMIPWEYKDWFGWHSQEDGNHFLGLFIENGRVKDDGDFKLKSALRKICSTLNIDMVVTPNQNLVLKSIRPSQKAQVLNILKEHNIKLPEEYSPNRSLAMACPAFPLCGLAITEAERVMPSIVDRIDGLLQKVGLQDETIAMRMTGCPNGCARPYMAEMGFVGSGPGTYQIWMGGCPNQTRLAFPLLDKVREADFESFLLPLFEAWKDTRKDKEKFGDFCFRIGKDTLLKISPYTLEKGKKSSDDGENGVSAAPAAEVASALKKAPAPARSPAPTALVNGIARGSSESTRRINLSPAVISKLSAAAAKKGVSTSELANELIRNELTAITLDEENFKAIQEVAASQGTTPAKVAENLLARLLGNL